MKQRNNLSIGWLLIGVGIPLLMLVQLAGCGGSASKSTSPTAGRQTPAPTVVAPARAILFQPVFKYRGSDPRYQGTGFFTRAPNGKIAGVTSAHFLSRDGPPLLEAQWLDIRTEKAVAAFTRSWGSPGSAGTTTPIPDLRPDYLLLPAPEGIDSDVVLDLDPRETLTVNERVWFPNKDSSAAIGYQLITGQISDTSPRYAAVTLDQPVVLQSQSGSPVISQTTGKVVGTLSRGNLDSSGTNKLILAPSHAILKALASASQFPLLSEVIGKEGGDKKKRGE